MSESNIDKTKAEYRGPSLGWADPKIKTRWELKERYMLERKPAPGMGLDGYPLQKGKVPHASNKDG